MLKKSLFLILVLFTSYQFAEAQIRAYSNEFMSLGVGARALGMGNAHSAVTDDVSSAYWNPAGLNNVENLEIAVMHAEWFSGIGKYDYLGIAAPISNGDRTVGLSIIRFGVDDIPNTLNLVDGSGNVNYDNITTFSAADYGFLLSYAQEWKKLQIGGNVKIIHRKVGDFAKAWGFGLDLGAQYRVNDDLMLGASLRDATSTYNTWSFSFTDQEKEVLSATGNEVPINSVELTGQHLVLGGAYNLNLGEKLDLLAAVDLEMTFDERNTLIHTSAFSLDPRIGIEAAYNDMVYLRLGVNNFQRYLSDSDITKTVLALQPNVGVGLKLGIFNIDYALTGLGNFSSGIYSHIISLKFNFNKSNS